MTATWAAPLTVPERRVLAINLTRAHHLFRVAAQVRLRQGRDRERASLALAAAEAAELGRDVAGAGGLS